MTLTASPQATVWRAPIWPVIIAPVVVGVYYFAIKSAFAQSIISVLGNTATTDIDLKDIYAPQWGSHWIYRACAEIISVGFAAFVAAGLAYGRELAAAITGACIVSVGYLFRVGILIYAWISMDPNDFSMREPWYQYAIEGLMIVAPPVVGAYVAEAAHDMHRDEPKGFGGINRLHFLWLWIAAFWYGLGLITPMARLYTAGFDTGIIFTIVTLIINFIPAAAIAIPGYYGLALLTGHHGSTMHPAGRNLVGVLVLVFGFFVGLLVQAGWYWLFQKIGELIFG